jgi:hypothetical protein
MQKKWTGKSIDLASLSDFVEDFFRSQQYHTKKTKSASEIIITVLLKRSTMGLEEPISVRISGDPSDFTVDLKASELTARPIRTGLLTKSLGGGYFLLKTLKLQEELEKLEKEFWIYVEDKVAELTG